MNLSSAVPQTAVKYFSQCTLERAQAASILSLAKPNFPRLRDNYFRVCRQYLQKWRIFAKVATFHPSVAPKKWSGEISPNPKKVATFCDFQKNLEKSGKIQKLQQQIQEN